MHYFLEKKCVIIMLYFCVWLASEGNMTFMSHTLFSGRRHSFGGTCRFEFYTGSV